MTYRYWKWDTGDPPVYRSAPGGFYERWDPEARKWIDIGFPNSVSDYIYGEGGAGIVEATEAEIVAITGGVT